MEAKWLLQSKLKDVFKKEDSDTAMNNVTGS